MTFPFVIRTSGIHGRGAFATRPIAAGSRLGEYTGERVTRDEVLRRDDGESDVEHPATYRFAIDKVWLIDGASGGNDTRFINHGCEPNCVAVREGDRIYIDASRDVPDGGELLLDYKLGTLAPPTDEERQSFACYCGAPTCRGTMLRMTDDYRACSAAARPAIRPEKMQPPRNVPSSAR